MDQISFYRIKRDDKIYLINTKTTRLTDRNLKQISSTTLMQLADEVYNDTGKLIKHRYVVRCKCNDEVRTASANSSDLSCPVA